MLVAWLCFVGACQSSVDTEYKGLRGARFADSLGGLVYRYYVPPEADAEHPLPLVLYLHSNGRQGVDNEAHVDYRVTRWVENQREHPCFVLAPQLPKGYWVDTNFAKGSYRFDDGKVGQSMQLVIELLELFQKRYPIDRTRIYVVGTSLGGYGTWDLMMRRPQLIAAGVPIEGGGDPTQAIRVAGIPIWAFHGAKDKTVPVTATRAMIEALKAIHASPRYTEYPDVDHESAPRAFAAGTGLDDWLFEQHKPLH
ncbi:MAG: dienelactone hydrolase family protein [Polyangiales bacterium]